VPGTDPTLRVLVTRATPDSGGAGLRSSNQAPEEGRGRERPAFYALARGGWRDYVTLLHPPYTLWHLSYVAIGASLAPEADAGRLAWTLAAFALALGVGAHALDELHGRPLGTAIPDRVLVGLAVVSVGAAAAIGVGAALAWTPWLLPLVAGGAVLVPAYNLELWGGRLHSDLWFALAWGAFPLLTAYVAAAERVRGAAVLGAVFAALLSLAQRRLSTPVRTLRRRVVRVDGTVEHRDGRLEQLTTDALLAGPEGALRALTAATIALAATLLVLRFA
jgi:hypothetical protein